MKRINRGEQVKHGDHIYDIGDYTSFVYKDATNNCKHCYLDQISSAVNRIKRDEEPDDIIALLDKIFDVNAKVTFGINIGHKSSVDALAKYYTLISCVAIPTGYGRNTKQFHAIFFTNSTVRDMEGVYKQRFITEGIEVSTSGIKKEEIVEEVKQEEKKHVILDIDRILAYKSKYWLKCYLETLIS